MNKITSMLLLVSIFLFMNFFIAATNAQSNPNKECAGGDLQNYYQTNPSTDTFVGQAIIEAVDVKTSYLPDDYSELKVKLTNKLQVIIKDTSQQHPTTTTINLKMKNVKICVEIWKDADLSSPSCDESYSTSLFRYCYFYEEIKYNEYKEFTAGKFPQAFKCTDNFVYKWKVFWMAEKLVGDNSNEQPAFPLKSDLQAKFDKLHGDKDNKYPFRTWEYVAPNDNYDDPSKWWLCGLYCDRNDLNFEIKMKDCKGKVEAKITSPSQTDIDKGLKPGDKISLTITVYNHGTNHGTLPWEKGDAEVEIFLIEKNTGNPISLPPEITVDKKLEGIDCEKYSAYNDPSTKQKTQLSSTYTKNVQVKIPAENVVLPGGEDSLEYDLVVKLDVKNGQCSGKVSEEANVGTLKVKQQYHCSANLEYTFCDQTLINCNNNFIVFYDVNQQIFNPSNVFLVYRVTNAESSGGYELKNILVYDFYTIGGGTAGSGIGPTQGPSQCPFGTCPTQGTQSSPRQLGHFDSIPAGGNTDSQCQGNRQCIGGYCGDGVNLAGIWSVCQQSQSTECCLTENLGVCIEGKADPSNPSDTKSCDTFSDPASCEKVAQSKGSLRVCITTQQQPTGTTTGTGTGTGTGTDTVTTSPPPTGCGDGRCDSGEESTCPDDCEGAEVVCGDGECDESERDSDDVHYCPQDCEEEIPFEIACGDCWAGSECSCTLRGECDDGEWIVRNKVGNPLENQITTDISSKVVKFTPNNTGTIEVDAICDDPENENRTTVEVKKKFLECPDTCEVGKQCECTVNGCKYGSFVVKNKEKEPLSSSITMTIASEEFKGKFTPVANGTVEASAICANPVKAASKDIKITGQSITTTTTTTSTSGTPSGKFQPLKFECTRISSNYKCVLEYDNGLGEDAKVMFMYYKDTDELITYSGKRLVGQGKDTIDNTFEQCPSTPSTVYAYWEAYKASDDTKPVSWPTPEEMPKPTCP